MRASEPEYEHYLQMPFRQRRPIRCLGPWDFWTADEPFLAILVENRPERRAIVLEYEWADERQRDIGIIEAIPERNPPDEGMAAFLRPKPPCS